MPVLPALTGLERAEVMRHVEGTDRGNDPWPFERVAGGDERPGYQLEAYIKLSLNFGRYDFAQACFPMPVIFE